MYELYALYEFPAIRTFTCLRWIRRVNSNIKLLNMKSRIPIPSCMDVVCMMCPWKKCLCWMWFNCAKEKFPWQIISVLYWISPVPGGGTEENNLNVPALVFGTQEYLLYYHMFCNLEHVLWTCLHYLHANISQLWSRMSAGYWSEACLKHTTHYNQIMFKSTKTLEWEQKRPIQITSCTLLGSLTGKYCIANLDRNSYN